MGSKMEWADRSLFQVTLLLWRFVVAAAFGGGWGGYPGVSDVTMFSPATVKAVKMDASSV